MEWEKYPTKVPQYTNNQLSFTVVTAQEKNSLIYIKSELSGKPG